MDCKLQFYSYAMRSYLYEKITVSENQTYYEISDAILQRIKEKGERNLYLFMIIGQRNASSNFDLQGLLQLGNIMEVIDERTLSINLKELYEENEDNIIGQYIQLVQQWDASDEIKKKAMNYGLEALIRSKE